MFTRILVPVDLAAPEACAAALAAAIRLGAARNAAITALSVVPAWPGDLARAPEDHEPALAAWVDRHRGGARVGIDLRIGGSPAARILEAVEETGADLVAMASHAPVMSDYLLGSNAAHVALHAPCSVLVAREGAGEPVRHLLVPIDPARPEASDRAVAIAAAIARADGARRTHLAVLPVEAEAGPPDPAAVLAARWVGPGPAPEIRVVAGASVSGEIRAVAEALGIDLIVMASHDPRFGDALIGSNAAHVALHVPASVLVVR